MGSLVKTSGKVARRKKWKERGKGWWGEVERRLMEKSVLVTHCRGNQRLQNIAA